MADDEEIDSLGDLADASPGDVAAASGADGAGGADEAADSDDAYGGLLGAYPYAYRQSESRLFRVYAALSGLLAVLVVLLFAFALVDLLAGTSAAQGGTFTFSRAFFIVIMLGVLAPLVAPVLLVARRHRRTDSTERYDLAMAAVGFLFVFSVYLGLGFSTPASQQSAPTGPFAPAIGVLWALPRIVGFVPPLATVAILLFAHRRLGGTDSDDSTAA